MTVDGTNAAAPDERDGACDLAERGADRGGEAAAPARPRPWMYAATVVVMLVAGFAAGRGVARWRNPPPSAESEAQAKATFAALMGGAMDKGGMAAALKGKAATTPAPAAAGDDGGLSVGLVEPGAATIGEIAPSFSLDGPTAGSTVSLADHAGRAVLLNFWATWCAPCRHEMPFLQAVHDAHAGAEDLAVVAIDVDETPEQAAAYLAELGLTFPVGIDRDGRVADVYRIGTYPTTYLVGRDGRVMSIKQGAYANQFEVEQAASLMTQP